MLVKEPGTECKHAQKDGLRVKNIKDTKSCPVCKDRSLI